jgi:hypothetical protein
MIDILERLPEPEKKAIISLCCVVEAQNNNGRYSTKETNIERALHAVFNSEWVGFYDIEFRNNYIISCLELGLEESIRLISNCCDEVKYEFHVIVLDFTNENSFNSTFVCAKILENIGYKELIRPKDSHTKTEKETNEDDGTYVVEDAIYVRIINTDAVRGENDDKYEVFDEDSNTTTSVYANYQEWFNNGICPTNGLVGYVSKKIDTEEGTICLVICEAEIIIPVLEFGLEEIDQHEYIEKRTNNRIIAYDKSNERCIQLRGKTKISSNEKIRPQKRRSTIIRHFYAQIQERFEPGKQFPRSNIMRHIVLEYTANGAEVTITVKGIMQPRHARIESDNGTVLKYRDLNNDMVYYEVETSRSTGSVVRVSLFQPNLDFNYIEYRYTL